MHSLNHAVLGHIRRRRARRPPAERVGKTRGARSARPYPVRGRAAFAAGRVARRLDPAAARRAVA